MCSLPAKYECHTLVCAPQPVGYKHNISRGNKSLYYSYCSSGSLLVLDCCSDLIFPHKIWYFNKNVCKVVQMLHKVAKLKFCGTISWYFNQEVDENINNWRKCQRLSFWSSIPEILKSTIGRWWGRRRVFESW